MDLAQEVGYIKGMQQANQRELGDIRERMATKDDVAALRTELSDKIDDAVERLQGSSGTQRTLKDQHWLITIVKSPVTPMFIAFFALLIMFLIMVSALTKREASSLLPVIPSVSDAPK